MALQQPSFGCLPRRSVDACLFAVPASASISVPSDPCVRIPCWDGASSSSKRFPFLGARVPSACDPKRLNWRKRVSEVVQVQLKEYGFDDHSKGKTS